jgi:hypothetical protein
LGLDRQKVDQPIRRHRILGRHAHRLRTVTPDKPHRVELRGGPLVQQVIAEADDRAVDVTHVLVPAHLTTADERQRRRPHLQRPPVDDLPT